VTRRLREIAGPGNDSHLTQLLYGGGVAFTNSAGVPWTAAYVDTIGDPMCDLRSNIAAEARAKITYERLINCTDDPGLREALGFLMTREVSHQLGLQLPCAVVPLLWFTTRRAYLGCNAFRATTGIALWAIAAFIIAINFWLAYRLAL